MQAVSRLSHLFSRSVVHDSGTDSIWQVMIGPSLTNCKMTLRGGPSGHRRVRDTLGQLWHLLARLAADPAVLWLPCVVNNASITDPFSCLEGSHISCLMHVLLGMEQDIVTVNVI